MGFRVLGFRVSGFRVSGFRASVGLLGGAFSWVGRWDIHIFLLLGVRAFCLGIFSEGVKGHQPS